MEARIVDLTTLFETEVSYRIPQFQRPYAWRRTKQWEPLWDDVRKKCERIIDNGENSEVLPHFMGAIVLQPRSHTTGEVIQSLVVDGQQRLTTLQLLIKAAEEALQSVNETVRAHRLRKLTINSENFWGGDSANETKIRQSNQNDQQSFQLVIRSISEIERYLHSIVVAHRYFKGLITEWLNTIPTERAARAKALEETITKHLQVAAIDLDALEKPHFIFEILNTRAETLAQSDLVKNTVMYEADVIDDVEQARFLWGMFDDNEWWRNQTKEGRLNRIHLDRFLNYWIVMKARREITAERVSGEFTSFIERVKPSQNIHSVATDLRKAGLIYEDLEKARMPEIGVFLRRMKTMELGVVMPPLMWLYTNAVPQEKLLNSIRVLESFLIRRMLCGINTQGLNRLFIELLAHLESNGIHSADQTITDFLHGQIVENRSWPNDRVLKDNLIDVPMKGNINRRVMVLEAIEMHLRTEKTEEIQLQRLTLEHIMPQSWNRNWPLPINTHDEAEASETRNQAVKEIGNLTLTTSKLNSSLSNSPWNEKQETLRRHTALRLNWELLDDAPEIWDEMSIRERSQQLAKLAICIWPSGESFASSFQ